METAIHFILQNLPLVTLALAILLAFFVRRGQSLGEALTRYILLLPLGVCGIWGFYYHAFYPEMSAALIGWEDSPFQYEVAAANLGIGVAGIIGFWKSWDFALAVALMAVCFLGGAAIVHLREIYLHANYAPGNAGSILITDILIPLLLLAGIFLWEK